MLKFISYEWRYWLKAPMTWIFLLINTLLVFGAVSSDNIVIGGGTGNVLKNSPYVIQGFYGAMSLIGLLMTTAFMNATATRDFHYNMYQFIFSSPIKKHEYFFGKFIGAGLIAVLPLLGVTLGALIAPYMPWVQPERYGEVIWSGHLSGLLLFGLPNTLIAATWIYCLSVIFRSNVVSFVGAMLILVLYAVSQGFTRDIEKEWLANLLDPFGFRPLNIAGKYMTVAEKNNGPVPATEALLFNRLCWMAISGLILVFSYFRFSFSSRNEKQKKKTRDVNKSSQPILSSKIFEPGSPGKFTPALFLNMLKLELLSIVKNPTFIIIVLIGLINLIASLTSFTGRFGESQYPVTYDIIDTIRDSFYLFLIAIITFYSGVLVWKERDARINEIQDSTPVPTSALFVSKLIAMIFCLALIMVGTILIGIITQTLYGYTRFQIDVYLKSLLAMDLLTFSYLVILAILLHYLINNRYVAYFSFVVIVLLNQFIWDAFEINSNMVEFGSTPSVIYSDMNGFGPFVNSFTWFGIYWLVFSILLCFVIFAFYIRGKENEFKSRLKYAGTVFGRNKLSLAAFVIIYLLCSGFVYYNTEILNKQKSSKELEDIKVGYEQKYKKYQGLLQPRYYSYKYNISIYPRQRSVHANVEAWARNMGAEPINELHFTMPTLSDSLLISIKGATTKLRDNQHGYRIYNLNMPLKPGDSILLSIVNIKNSKGFENEISFTQLTQNGTFFNNMDIVPRFGYHADAELSDKHKRSKRKLPKKARMPKLDEHDKKNRANNYLTIDADWVRVNTIISTDTSQLAVAPGSLKKEWVENGRKFFHYELDQPSFDFYSFISAEYVVSRKKWKGIDLEVYHIPEHAYNVPNMMLSLEKSLAYYTQNFGKYYHKQCRIIEFPRYSSFAQAFPGTMPYSESVGFIADLRDVKEEGIDAVFYVVAHEMGHQYWAHQVCGAEMQGSEMMSEGFAQYSALMVMEQEYGKDKMKKFLKYEMDSYLRGRSREFEAERPLMQTEHQGYIHYEKASVVLYYLKEMIGEEKVNQAMRSLIDSFAYKQPPYPTSLSAVNAFRKVTPDSLQYLIKDLFETITLFSNRIVSANYQKTEGGYLVNITTKSEKYRSDSLGKETSIPVDDIIDIGIFAEPEHKSQPGKKLVFERKKITRAENSWTFKTKEKPYQAGIDPYNYLIDRIPDDNLKTISEK